MNRLLSILVTVFLLFLVYLWIHRIMSGPEEDAARATKTRVLNDDEVRKLKEALEAPPAEKEETQQEVPIDTVPEVEQGQEDIGAVEDVESTTRPEPEPEINDPPPDPVKDYVNISKQTTAGKHLVIAGNFLQRANAQTRVDKLVELGYAKAEIVNFELSQYHTACAGRYDDLTEARRIAKRLGDYNDIDAYVRAGN